MPASGMTQESRLHRMHGNICGARNAQPQGFHMYDMHVQLCVRSIACIRAFASASMHPRHGSSFGCIASMRKRRYASQNDACLSTTTNLRMHPSRCMCWDAAEA